MKTMLLAAGEGRRMRPLTDHLPKPLVAVGDQPLIAHQLARLRAAGLTDLVINTAYLGHQIEAALGHGAGYGVTIEYSREPYPLETGGGIARALPLLGRAPFVLLSADSWVEYPLIELSRQSPPTAGAHMILVPNPAHHPQGDFALRENGQVSLDQGERLTYSGLALIDPALIATYPQRREQFSLAEALRWAIADGRVTGAVWRGYWLDVGTPERLQELTLHLRRD